VSLEKRRWMGGAVKTKVDAVFLALNRYARVGDIMIQQQPEYTALVWGAFRGLLMVRLFKCTAIMEYLKQN
jgi:hypothetical protein